MRRRALVIHNPTAGRRRRALLEAVLRHLEARGMACDLRPTAGPGDATALAATSHRTAHDVVIAAGGDGTVNEVATGLLRSAAPPPLAVVPLGTANVLAVELGLPRAPEALARLIAEAPAGPVHPALAGDRAVLLMAGAGFDAAVVHGVGRRLKRALGKGAYVLRTLWEMGRDRAPPLRVTADTMALTARMVVACKSRHYGGPYIAAPDARLAAPTLEVLAFHGRGPLARLRYGLALLRGRVTTLPDVTVLTARRVLIDADRPICVQIDGDAAGHLPLSLRPADTALAVVGAAVAVSAHTAPLDKAVAC